jgi:hypothetical protein
VPIRYAVTRNAAYFADTTTTGRSAGQHTGMQLSPPWRKAVLTTHVVTAVGWLGVDLVQLTLGIAGVTGAADAGVVYPAFGLIGTALFVPLSFLVWLVGVVNALYTPWRLLRYRWVVTKLAIVTLMLFLVVFALYPNLADAWTLGAATPRQTRLNLVVAPSVSTSLLIFATVLSTYKPWGRRRRVAPDSA